jgi:hypothetical protein
MRVGWDCARAGAPGKQKLSEGLDLQPVCRPVNWPESTSRLGCACRRQRVQTPDLGREFLDPQGMKKKEKLAWAFLLTDLLPSSIN